MFFFGILADVTLPVCLAAFAGAGIANANPMRVGVSATRIAIAGFLIPYAFILEPALLLRGHRHRTFLALSTVILGMIGVSYGLAGYLIARGTVLDRLLLVAGGVMLIYPDLAVPPGTGLGVTGSQALGHPSSPARSRPSSEHQRAATAPATVTTPAPATLPTPTGPARISGHRKGARRRGRRGGLRWRNECNVLP